MTEHPDDQEPAAEPRRGLPRWIPILIGVILLGMAGLAVFTGLQYRGGPLGSSFRRAGGSVLPSEGGAPGEPQPGASRIVHGAAGDYVPRPSGAQGDVDRSEVVITGGADGVIPSIRLTAQRAMSIEVEPSDALIYVNGQLMGTANQFQSPDLYDFPEVGEYAIRVVAPGFEEIEYVVAVDPAARTEVATIETKLKRTAGAGSRK